MFNTTIMNFKTVYSKKYKQYISIANENNNTYTIPKDKPALTGYLEVESVQMLTPNFYLANARPILPEVLTMEDIDIVCNENFIDRDCVSVVDMLFININDNRCVFKRDGEFYLAQCTMPNATKLSVINDLEDRYIPYDVALFIAATRDLHNVSYDGTFVYSDSLAYTVDEMEIISVPKVLVHNGSEQPIPDSDIEEFMYNNYISHKFSKHAILIHTYYMFGQEIELYTFSRNGMSLSDYLYGSANKYKVINSFRRLNEFKNYACKKLGIRAISDLNQLSVRKVLS